MAFPHPKPSAGPLNKQFYQCCYISTLGMKLPKSSLIPILLQMGADRSQMEWRCAGCLLSWTVGC